MRHRLLLSPFPRVALDRRATYGCAFRGICIGMRIDRPRTVAVPAHNQQLVAPAMSPSHPEDARAKSQASRYYRRSGQQLVGTDHPGVPRRSQTLARTCLRAGDGDLAGPRSGTIALVGICPHMFVLRTAAHIVRSLLIIVIPS